MKEKIKGKIIEIFKILISPILVVVANAIRGYQSVLFRVAKDINLNPIVFTTIRCSISVIILFVLASSFEGFHFHKAKHTLLFASLGFFAFCINQ